MQQCDTPFVIIFKEISAFVYFNSIAAFSCIFLLSNTEKPIISLLLSRMKQSRACINSASINGFKYAMTGFGSRLSDCCYYTLRLHKKQYQKALHPKSPWWGMSHTPLASVISQDIPLYQCIGSHRTHMLHA